MTRSQDREIVQLYQRHVETLSQRYANALDHCGAERALIFAGVPQLRDRDDQPVPFRADPYFIQWVPLAQAAGSIVEFRIGQQPRLVLPTKDDFWHARPSPPPHEVLELFEVIMATRGPATDYLSQNAGRTLAIGRVGADIGAPDDSQAFIRYLDYDRAIKTDYEIECIRRANRRAVAGHRAVAQALSEGVSEFELHMQYCLACEQTDVDAPYPGIIGLNEHAAVLHYQHRETAPPPRVRSLLIDAGAQVNGYAADITRTYCLADDRFAELISATEKLQLRVCDLVSAGTDYVSLNDRCHALLAEILVEFELVRCSADTAWEDGVTTAFLPHGLGHLLGLQVHDVGGRYADRYGTVSEPPARHPFLRLTRTLAPDMVLTIEPGIYFIKSLLDELERKMPGVLRHDRIEALLPYGGIRIEDDVRVESRGHENLTRGAYSA